jgi:ATP-dependent Clp protease ATP-binding subunit ClpB
MLQRLQGRLKKQNILLEVGEPLIEAVARGGYNPAQGARPMQRFLQDKVEKLISEKIIKKEIKPGKVFSLAPEDLAALEKTS